MLSEFILLLAFMNIIPLWSELDISSVFKITGTLFLSAGYLTVVFRRGKKNSENKKLRGLKRGASLMRLGGYAAAAEIPVLSMYYINSCDSLMIGIFSALTAVLAVGGVIFSGVVRTTVHSRQIKPKDHLLMLMMWYIPLLNIIPLRRFYKKGCSEYLIEKARIELDAARAENEICKTKYPILLVHGIFFRDWQLVNYWGRIPAALIKNGASIFYGKQQSSLAIKDSAAELHDSIMNVLAETGASKVNIIAHSKGGLDSRYAISCLGDDKYVASLTTINTPHMGCDMVDYLLKKIPDSIKNHIAKRYNGIFSRLGDTTPDFLAGVDDLRASKAASYDSLMPDSPLVSYRSYMTVMQSRKSAGFPLNIGYMLINKLNGENDGLVWEKSAQHGKYTLIRPTGKRGISHGDVIDLFREDINGFDVRELFVSITAALKNEGF